MNILNFAKNVTNVYLERLPKDMAPPTEWIEMERKSVISLANIPSDRLSGNWQEQKHSYQRRTARSKCVDTSKAMLTKVYSNNFGTT